MNHLTDSQLNEYLDHALDKTTRRKFDSHLQTCADCSARLDELNFLFASLEALPEIKLRRDLSPAIRARLPQSTAQKQTRIWTPSFAAQLGTALGVFIWLSMEITNSITPIISTFHFSLPSIVNFQFSTPDFRFPNPYSLFSILYSPSSIFNSLFSISKLQLPTFDFPTFQHSTLNFPTLQPSTLNLSTSNLIFISAGIFILWLAGNLSLLRNRSGVQK